MHPQEQQRIVSLLCENGADLEACGKGPWNVLHFCSYYGRTDLVQILLASGAAVDARAGVYSQAEEFVCFGARQLWYGGETVLICAAGRGPLECLLCLMEGKADVTIADAMGNPKKCFFIVNDYKWIISGHPYFETHNPSTSSAPC